MLKILTPISHLFTESEENIKIIMNCSDQLEARERTAHLRLDKTSHYHIDFDLNIGITEIQKEFLYNQVRDRENIINLTFQAAKDCQIVTQENGMYIPKSEPLELADQIARTKKSIDEIRDIVGSDRNIGIENNNFYPTGAYDICTSIQYLQEVLSLKNLHLLLDIAHAKVSAFNLNIDLNDYIEPLLKTNLCKQVHICEPVVIDNKDGGKLMMDKHGIPSSSLTEYTLEFMKRFDIIYLTCEYYKNADILAQYLYNLKSISQKEEG